MESACQLSQNNPTNQEILESHLLSYVLNCHSQRLILHKLERISSLKKTITKSMFRGALVLEIIERHSLVTDSSGPPPSLSARYRMSHRSTPLYATKRRRCVVCWGKTLRGCPDCSFTPALCQTSSKTCHTTWHSIIYDSHRMVWFLSKRAN